jgi:acetyltransferase-like isoleucine patch superfamily enzyme
MIKLLKKYLRRILYKIYRIGHDEYVRRQKETELARLKRLMTFNENSVIFHSSTSIINYAEKKDAIVIGEDTMLYGQLMIIGKNGKILIGKHCFIGESSKIWASLNITIGDRVFISHNVNIHDNISHSITSFGRHREFMQIVNGDLSKEGIVISESKIVIEDDAWIGFNATILKGVKIGKGAVIGANTLITKDVEPYAVVVGSPPRVIKYTE